MRRLEELLRQMCQASKAIGNTELENKFAEGISFVFSLSFFFSFLTCVTEAIGSWYSYMKRLGTRDVKFELKP